MPIAYCKIDNLAMAEMHDDETPDASALCEKAYACIREKNYYAAEKWLRKAAELGNVDAQRDLGNLLGYPGFAGNNAVESLKWLRAAAEHENADAQREIGDIYRGQCLGKR